MTAPSNALLKTMTTLSGAIHRDYPLTLALIFSRVAASGPAGVLMSSVQRDLMLTSAQLTRSVQTLATLHYRKQRPGLDLLEVSNDATSAQYRLLRLTPKGAELHAACRS
jgi:DNA-binding MarR family transcriptional regulator